MIKRGDVVRLKIPHPDPESALAHIPHMYICVRTDKSGFVDLVKCQTLKTHLLEQALSRAVVATPEQSNSCFRHSPLIDCDKVFRIADGCNELKSLQGRKIPEALLLQIDYNLTNPTHKFRIYAYASASLLP